jgi:hypothetical protein
MSTVGLIIGGALVAALIIGAVSTLAWYIETALYEPVTNYDMSRHALVNSAINDFWASFFTMIITIPSLFISAFYGIVSNVVHNLGALALVLLMLTAGTGILQYHHELYRAELIVSQCIVMPFCNHFLFPFLNIVRIVYNTGIIPFDFGVDLYAFYEWGPILVFLKCTIHTTMATDLFAYFTNIFFVLSMDVIAWFNAGFMTSDLDIRNTLDAIGLFVETLIGPFNCLCRALNFIYNGLALWARLDSLHDALNCILNFVIRVLQIPINTMMVQPHRPNFEEATLRACCALKSTANTLQDTVLIIAEIFWGVFTNIALPTTIREVLSVKWARIFAEPLCGGARFVNMSLTAIVHYDGLAQPTGIAYWQFGHVVDEFKASAGFVASVFTLLNNDAQALVDQGLLSIINAVAFLLEWIPGNIYYWLYGGPLAKYPTAPYGSFVNFLKYYFPDYWLKPGFVDTPFSTYVYHTALADAFTATFQLTQALGNLFANILNMEPLGGIIQHILNIIVCFVRVLLNLISFIFTIVTFDSDVRTTARQVDFDCIFNEMYFLAGSLGDFSRQFATPNPLTNLTCQIDAQESQNNVFCCLGNLIERFVDVITIALQQSVHFLQDLITLPTGNVIFCIAFIGFNHSLTNECLRIPDLSTALFLLDASLCDLTCTVFSIIPMLTAFQCSFPLPLPPVDPTVPPQPPKPCGHVNTCLSVLICRILRFFLAPLIVLNTFIARTIRGESYSDYTVLGSFILKVYCNILADALAAFGLLVNCTLCAFVGSGINCDDSIYQLFVSIGDLVKFLPMIFTTLFTIVVKLVLTFIIGLFTGDPIGAVIKFIVGVLTDLFGGLGTAVVNFLVRFFNAIGLGFVGTFIQILWRGFCPLLQLLLNAIIVVLKVITFGAVQINFVNFCCDGAPGCQPSQRKRSLDFDETGIIDGVLNVNLDNWIAATVQMISWDVDNPCNQTMARYAGYSWNNLTEWEQNEVLFCLMKPYWNLRTDNQTELPSPFTNSTCDVLMMEYNSTNWSTIDVLSRRFIIDCMQSRMFTDGVRNSLNLEWIPQDIMTNPYRKWAFGLEFARGLFIYWQYFSDKEATSDQFLSPTYQQNWATMGLYTGFYAGIHNADQITAFRDSVRLVDYFQWNNATQYEAVDAVSIGFWNFTNTLLNSLFGVITAKTDSNLDPTQYLQYSYSMDSATAGITSSFYALLGQLFYTAQNISAFWSNPQNVKKRSSAYVIMQEGGAGMWRSTVNQLTMMGIDYRMSKINESRYWAGNCSLEEGQQFMDEYDRWVHHDERSWAYHLSRWWDNNKDTMFTPHPITNPRDGQRRLSYNQSQHLFSYTDNRGQLVAESGRSRVNRLVGGLNAGSAQSNRRWNAMAHLVDIAKERVYVNIIRRNMVFAVEYMNRVYAGLTDDGSQTLEESRASLRQHEAERERQRQERLDRELLEKYYEQKDAATLVWMRQSSTSGEPSAVEKQRLEAQHLHCNRPEMRGDGFCKDYKGLPPADNGDKEEEEAPGPRTSNYYDKVERVTPNGRKYVIESEGPITNDGPAKGVVLMPRSSINTIRRTHFVTQSLVLLDSFIDLTCYTNITFANSTLCEECFIVDQALGRVETGLNWVEEYFVDGQYRHSLNVSMAYFDYAADDSAYVIVGDGPQLSVHGFPGYDGTWYYNLRYVGDDTANKTRFDDVIALVNNATANSTIPFPDITTDYYYINGWVIYVMILVMGTIWNLIVDFLTMLSGGSGGVGFTEDVAYFFLDWFILCDWLTGEDYRGIRKRFSFGETVVMFLTAWVVLSVVFIATVKYSFLSLLAYVGVSFIFILSFFRSISNNFSFLCLPGLDAMLADDAFYFLVYSLMSKCSWFLAFLILDESYDNTTCYACESASGWNILNCVTDRGFGDIFANIIFMAQAYYPQSLEWIRDSTIPPVAMFYQIPYINQRINAFATVDLSDRANYRQYMGCNYIITLFWNSFFLVAFAYLLTYVWPAFAAPLAASLLILNFLYRFYVMVELMAHHSYISRVQAPYVMMGLVDTPVAEHVDEVEDHEYEQDGYRVKSLSGNNYSEPKQMRTRYQYQAGSGVSFKTLRNLGQRLWDNWAQTERKKR